MVGVIAHSFRVLRCNIYEVTFTEKKRQKIPYKHSKARFKRRILHVPNLMQMRENNRFFSFALDSAHVKCDVWNAPKI